MRPFVGVVSGFVLTSVLVLAGEWGYTLAFSPTLNAGHTPLAIIAALLSLLYIAISAIIGGFLAAVISDAPETLGGYSVLQMFFAVWFFREFWTTSFIWYKPTALFLIIPCAMLARHWAQGSYRSFGVPQQSNQSKINA